jgi:hypothetical protein
METDELKRRNRAFLDSSVTFYHHIARLTLYGATDAAEALRAAYDLMHEVRQPLVVEDKIPTYKELVASHEEIGKAISSFHLAIRKAYEADEFRM